MPRADSPEDLCSRFPYFVEAIAPPPVSLARPPRILYNLDPPGHALTQNPP